VLVKKTRIGKRGFDELRELKAQVGVLPRVHGSAVFNRGETQALATVTLGPKKDSQSLDAVTGGVDEKSFMLHYNFPPYSVGEVGRLGTTGRREIGHGNLAERSLVPILPDNYPYAVRVVSEIMGSNGSSSMASACVGTLALMDAGVPIKAPVAGISVGLFTGDNGQSELVLDILGTEDHCGDMDFKVVGTREGITSFQVDLKIPGLNWEQVEGAFEMARNGRLQILDYMQSVIEEPRTEMSKHAPRVEVVKIDPEKIGALIGPGGKVIRGITETYGVQIDVEEDGTVSVFSNNGDSMKAALKEINGITAEAEIGKIYEGLVRTVRDFGAFVEILPGKDGLVHISELADFRVGKVEDICKEGDMMWVKVLDVDRDGKIRLSRKAAMAEKDAEAHGEDQE
jgi:polyribonucleotide nucleotidyltransferase